MATGGVSLRRLFGAAVVFVLLALVGRGLLLVGYEPVRSDAYLWGAFHVHSTLSDGLAGLEEIAREAKDARVNFVMLSDHGAPHPEAATLARTIDGVRFVGGSEVGLPDGHLIVSDAERLPLYTLPPFPPDAVAEAAEWGGVAIVTYPEDPLFGWSYWKEDFAPNGIEIVNVTSYFRSAGFGRKIAWAFFSLFNRNYYISGFEPPAYALERWDELLSRGRVFALYANNAHGGFPLSEDRSIPVPSYRTALAYVGLGVDRRYEDEPELAIRRGDFFAIVRAAGEPSRFEIVREGESIRVALEGGGYPARLDLKRNGSVVASTGNGELRYQIAGPGAYRVEAFLLGHPLLRGDVPWILSNPIFVGGDLPSSGAAEFPCDSVEPVALEELRLEMDEESRGTVEMTGAGSLRLRYQLSKATAENVDRWVALSLREPLDLFPYRGIFFEAESPEPMRYWIEVRSGDDGHYASVKVGPGMGAIAVPWERFYPTVGERREIPLRDIDSLFVTVNTSSSRTGFPSKLEVRSFGFCR